LPEESVNAIADSMERALEKHETDPTALERLRQRLLKKFNVDLRPLSEIGVRADYLWLKSQAPKARPRDNGMQKAIGLAEQVYGIKWPAVAALLALAGELGHTGWTPYNYNRVRAADRRRRAIISSLIQPRSK
jgi:hypothetical protein